jgi:hypothetical protein
MKQQLLGALALASLLPLGVHADGFSYTYAQIDYLDGEFDEGNVEGDGVRLSGALAINDLVHLYALYQELDFERGIDTSFFEVGAGLNYALGPDLDLVGRLGYIDADLDTPSGSGDDSGLTLRGTVRGRVASSFELEGGVRYVDLDESGDDTSLVAEGRWFFLPQLALGLGVDIGDDFTVWNVGLRGNF